GVDAILREQADDFRLNLVGVLEFIDEDRFEMRLVMCTNCRGVLQQVPRGQQQIIKIHRVGGALSGAKSRNGQCDEVGEGLSHGRSSHLADARKKRVSVVALSEWMLCLPC